MIKNWSSTLKSTKKCQNSSKQKNRKNQKTRKSEKVIKSKNQNNQKVRNQKSEKHEKWSKNAPPLKKAKMSDKWHFLTLCVFRAAWLGTFSIPGGTTGPGFKAEIRPPLFLMIFDQFYHFFTFNFCAFWCFSHFMEMSKLTFLRKCPFFDIDHCNVIRPYGNWLASGRLHREIHRRGEWEFVWWFSPHFCLSARLVFFVYCVQDVGEITQERRYVISTLVLPSLNRMNSLGFDHNYKNVGEITQGRFSLTLVLPSLKPKSCFNGIWFFHFVHFDVLHL